MKTKYCMLKFIMYMYGRHFIPVKELNVENRVNAKNEKQHKRTPYANAHLLSGIRV